MLDLRFICENADLVKENIKRKFKDDKLPLVDEVIELYKEKLAANTRANDLRANRNKVSKQIGVLMGQGKRDEAEDMKRLVNEQAAELKALEEKEDELLLSLFDSLNDAGRAKLMDYATDLSENPRYQAK